MRARHVRGLVPRFNSHYVTLLRVRHVGHRPRRPPREAYVSIRQHTSAYVSIEEHTSAYVSIRQRTSAYVSIRQHTSAYVSTRQQTSADVSRRQQTSAYVSIRQHTSAYVSVRQHTSAYVDMLGIDRVGHREKNSPKFTARACASGLSAREEEDTSPSRRRPLAIASPYSTRQHTSAYVSIRRRWRRALAIAFAY
jgi:hypothetical protein